MPSGIFCLQPWFLQQSKHISPRKTPVYMSIELRAINNCLSIKMKSWPLFDDITEVFLWFSRSVCVQAVRSPEVGKFFSFVFGDYFKKWIVNLCLFGFTLSWAEIPSDLLCPFSALVSCLFNLCLCSLTWSFAIMSTSKVSLGLYTGDCYWQSVSAGISSAHWKNLHISFCLQVK